MAKEVEEETTISPRLSSASSHEFSFWPSSSLSVPTCIPDLSSADDLFSNGFLLPTLSSTPNPPPETKPDPEPAKEVQVEIQTVLVPTSEPGLPLPNPASVTAASSSSSPSSSSKRWKEIFKLGEKEKPVRTEETKTRHRKEKKTGTSTAGSVPSADISINIWPFGRSRSAGTAGSSRKPAGVLPIRKSCSAPCSRSNSRGESGKPGPVGRRWAASPGRTGVHVGRTSPVWQLKRTGGSVSKPVEPVKVGSGSARVINFSVNSCIGYGMGEGRCGGESKDGVTGGERHGGLFGIKGLFSKKAVH